VPRLLDLCVPDEHICAHVIDRPELAMSSRYPGDKLLARSLPARSSRRRIRPLSANLLARCLAVHEYSDSPVFFLHCNQNPHSHNDRCWRGTGNARARECPFRQAPQDKKRILDRTPHSSDPSEHHLRVLARNASLSHLQMFPAFGRKTEPVPVFRQCPNITAAHMELAPGPRQDGFPECLKWASAAPEH